MKIEQLLMQPIGQKIGGFTLSIKTYKKSWQVGSCWWHQVICMDETGEIPVDVKIGTKYNPLRGRAIEFNVIVAQVQEAEYLGKDRKKLVVDQFSIPTTSIGDLYSKEDEIIEDYKIVIRGKIKCLLVAAKVQHPKTQYVREVLEFAEDPKLARVIDSIMEG